MYLHELLKVLSIAAIVGLIAHEWLNILDALAIALVLLYLLLVRAG